MYDYPAPRGVHSSLYTKRNFLIALTDGTLVVNDTLLSQHKSEKLTSRVCKSIMSVHASEKFNAGN